MSGVQQRSQIVERTDVLRTDLKSMAKGGLSVFRILVSKVSRSQIVISSRCVRSQAGKLFEHGERLLILSLSTVSNAEQVTHFRVRRMGPAIIFQ